LSIALIGFGTSLASVRGANIQHRPIEIATARQVRWHFGYPHVAANCRAAGKITHSKSEKPDYRADNVRQLLREKSDDFHGVAVSHF
jgi:hypothetical protein